MSRAAVVRASEIYRPTAVNEELRGSALALIRQLVAMEGVQERHHREAVSLALWKWTEAFGIAPYAKYNLRYVSRGVMEAPPEVKVNHEHVFPRKWLVPRLLDLEPHSPEFESFLDENGAACIVTLEEHGALGAARGTGWMRYVSAGVDVYDRLQQTYVEPATLMPGGAIGTDPPSEQPVAGDYADVDATVRPDRGPSVEELVHQHVDSARVPLLLRLARSARLSLGVTLPQQSKGTPRYFRVHDAVIEEPTRAAAYVNFNGTVDLALTFDDLHETLRRLDWVEPRAEGQKPYLVRCRVTDATSMETAEDLVGLALERVRDEY